MRLLRLDPGERLQECLPSATLSANITRMATSRSIPRWSACPDLRTQIPAGRSARVISGNIDAATVAAYRYTEARLTQVAIDPMDGSTRMPSIPSDSTVGGEV